MSGRHSKRVRNSRSVRAKERLMGDNFPFLCSQNNQRNLLPLTTQHVCAVGFSGQLALQPLLCLGTALMIELGLVRTCSPWLTVALGWNSVSSNWSGSWQRPFPSPVTLLPLYLAGQPGREMRVCVSPCTLNKVQAWAVSLWPLS